MYSAILTGVMAIASNPLGSHNGVKSFLKGTCQGYYNRGLPKYPLNLIIFCICNIKGLVATSILQSFTTGCNHFWKEIFKDLIIEDWYWLYNVCPGQGSRKEPMPCKFCYRASKIRTLLHIFWLTNFSILFATDCQANPTDISCEK